MSKAILVLDMPGACKECPLHHYDECEDLFCVPTENLIFPEWIEENRKPDWCPLYHLPEKKETVCFQGENWISVDKKKQNEGWNACVDELTKMGGK